MGSKVKFEVDVIWGKGDLIVLVSRNANASAIIRTFVSLKIRAISVTFVSDRAAEAIVKGEPRKPECMMEKGSTDHPDTRTDILIYEREDALRNMREDLQTNFIAYQCCIFFKISRRIGIRRARGNQLHRLHWAQTYVSGLQYDLRHIPLLQVQTRRRIRRERHPLSRQCSFRKVVLKARHATGSGKASTSNPWSEFGYPEV